MMTTALEAEIRTTGRGPNGSWPSQSVQAAISLRRLARDGCCFLLILGPYPETHGLK